ncbi:GH25 family lysozyme [Microbacterium halotolerans]|uniref:GH25 family lysozyme n=1 Tax=Microbacterium halotolerans TaxID=246613 RepID=UPI000E6A9E16|nr:GH25 family lysozyme [Microbacterium halotolerans]
MTLNGIDVSGWQPNDITGLVDYDFAIVKASENLAVTGSCDPQVQHARKRGKQYGVYHFARPGSPRQQAEFFVKNVKGYVGEGILVLDLEANGLTTWGGDGAFEFMDRVCDLTGVKPLLYSFGSALSSSDMRQLVEADFGLWTAHWNNRTSGSFSTPPDPMTGVWPFAAVHQYTDRGHLPGYSGPLDLNIFHGDVDTWHAYATGDKIDSKPSTPKPTPKPSVKTLAVDGLLGPATIGRWQKVMGTPADGLISKPSVLVKAVQRHLNESGARDWDGRKLAVDGLGIGPNVATAAGKTRTIWALQDYLGTTTDGILSKGGSPAVKALQKRLNKGTF